MRLFFRRWKIPVILSLLINMCIGIYCGDWLRTETIFTPDSAHLGRARIVYIPQNSLLVMRQAAARPLPSPKLAPPREYANNPNRSSDNRRAGARATPFRAVRVARETPETPSPLRNNQTADRDPYAPDIAPSAYIAPPKTVSEHEVQIPSPQSPSPVHSAQVAGLSGAGDYKTPSAAPGMMPSAGSGPPRTGDGGNGDAIAGSGAGGGGVLPFGLGGHGGAGHHRIIYIIDLSPSMKTRLPRATEELRQSMSNLSRDDLFDIFAFGETVVQMEPYLEPATPDAIVEANSFLRDPASFHTTNIQEALLEALEMRHVNEIVLLTDGFPTSGETDPKEIERDVRDRNVGHIPIDTIGLVGINRDGTVTSFEATDLLRSIAAQSGGNFRLVPLGAPATD